MVGRFDSAQRPGDGIRRPFGSAQRSFGSAHRERGVALITVMLVFVLVAVIATEMLRRSQLSMRSVGNLIETRQAYYYALGGEAVARQLLAKDAIEHPDIDTFTEAWAQAKEQQPFEIDHGKMQVEINDLQGRFNLNNAAAGDGYAQFVKLLTVLQLNPNYAKEWQRWIASTQAPADNPDAVVGPGKAETDISALRLLHSMQPADYAKLAPHVTVLPTSVESDPPKININTADDVVLRSLPTISESQVPQIVARQKNGGYVSTSAAGLDDSIASVTSNFFEVIVTVNYAERWQRVRTVLQRKKNGSKVEFVVISRVRSPLIDDMGQQ